MKLAALVILVAVGLIGCGGGVQSVDRIYYASSDPSISAEFLSTACQVWAPLDVVCQPAGDGVAANVIVTRRDTGGKFLGTTFLGYDDVISIEMDMQHDANVFNLAHEFGHALGLGHMDSGPALMNTAYVFPDDNGLTQIDIDGYQAVSATKH